MGMTELKLSIPLPTDFDREEELRELFDDFQKQLTRMGFPGGYAVWPAEHKASVSPTDRDWHLMARLEHLPGRRLLIASRPGIHLTFDQIRARFSDPNCDTCSVSRSRRVTYLLADGQEVLQVGSSCLKFVLDPAGEQQVRDEAKELGATAPTVGENGQRVALHEWLATVSAVVRLEGEFVKFSEDEQSSTAAIARGVLDGSVLGIHPTPFDRARAKSLVHFVRTTVAAGAKTSDFDRKLTAAYASDLVDDSQMNIAASAWLRHWGLAGKQSIGKANSPFEARVLLTKVGKPFRRGRHTMRSHLFEDPDGHWITWFKPAEPLEENATYALSGTIRRDKPFGGRTCTIVTNCSASEIAGELDA